jgi:uncharacterized membrane protein YeiH
MLDLLTVLAVICYAINGSLKAIQKQMDIFGTLVIALVTAIGGGTLRDLLLGRSVFWVVDPLFLYVGAATGILVLAATRVACVPTRSVLVTDSLGLALFAVIGATVAGAAGVPLVSAVLTGAMTGFAGGIARDVLCGEVPRVLKRDIHATAALTGSACFLLLQRAGIAEVKCQTAGIILVVVIRALEHRFGPFLLVLSNKHAR